MVLYALVSNVSIGDLFLAGIFPVLMGLVLMLANAWFSHRRDLGRMRGTLHELPLLTVKATPALLMPVYCLVVFTAVSRLDKPQQSQHYTRC